MLDDSGLKPAFAVLGLLAAAAAIRDHVRSAPRGARSKTGLVVFDLPTILRQIDVDHTLFLGAPPLYSGFAKVVDNDPRWARWVIENAFEAAGTASTPAAWRTFWDRLETHHPDLFNSQIAMVAHLLLASPALATATLQAVAAVPEGQRPSALRVFFRGLPTFDPEVEYNNPFRREEMVRRWIETWGGAISGETPRESEEALDRLDYTKVSENVGATAAARQGEGAESQSKRRRAIFTAAQQRERKRISG